MKGKIVSGPYYFDHPLSEEEKKILFHRFDGLISTELNKLNMSKKNSKSRRSFQKADIANFEAASTGLFNEFVRKYYGKDAEWEFVVPEKYGFNTVIKIADAFISLQNAYLIMKLGFTRNQYFDYINQYTDESGHLSSYSYYYNEILN